ncbi:MULTISPECIES: peptidase U32 family protein [unclassified Rummeliibacillus]|uniref:peptidase U32 family protein n=1 Tax=unclassified Rummeliibacillus TaxID=2622809 RepID=UPI000E662D41|nr:MULTISPECIES: peptidase U32 family protein [unclassified Rummeliibacillus]RIJ67529.1 U32 family peptidase [Rummeliibacillus sp. POC4]RPJ97089.1 U32 family peptidase [Rummeliibacillus sp. TYF005]
MKKPELLVTPQSIAHVKALIQAGADAFLIGEQQFGLRLAGEFTIEQVAEATTLIHDAGKKVYVAMNAIFHNDRVDGLAPYMRKLAKIGVDGIVFGDPAVIIAKREAEVDIPLHWSPETIATNWFQANYWGKRGATRAVLARELSMEEIIEIKENAEVEIQVQVHGMTCMFQSKRPLLGHYFMYEGKAMEVENRKSARNMYLYDKERNSRYPIYEDLNGTHIYSPNDMCIIDELDELFEAEIDAFKIEGVLQSEEYVVTVTECYRKAIDAYAESPDTYFDIKEELLAKIEEIQPELRPLDTGFFFKETVY